jgi:hypothetical protein
VNDLISATAYVSQTNVYLFPDGGASIWIRQLEDAAWMAGSSPATTNDLLDSGFRRNNENLQPDKT